MNYTKKKFIDMFINKVIVNGYTSNNSLFIKHYIKIFIASIVTATGLGSNNGSLIVGSLLISPLIDPISGILLYFYINKNIIFLLKYLLLFLIDIIIIFFVGYIFEYIFKKLHAKYQDKKKIIYYPTYEMKLRTGYLSIISNSFICLLAGILLINTYLSNDLFYLVGIYICISLIVPIANSGMLYYLEDYENSKESFLITLFGFIFLIISGIFLSYNK